VRGTGAGESYHDYRSGSSHFAPVVYNKRRDVPSPRADPLWNQRRRNSEMSTITGKVTRLLRTRDDRVTGFVLNTGARVHFPSGWAPRVLTIAPLNSSVEIHGCIAYGSDADDPHIDAQSIENLDSRESAVLHSPSTTPSPEASAASFPPRNTADASGSPSENFAEYTVTEGESQESSSVTDSLRAVAQAYDRLHRIQSMLLYLKMMKQHTGTMANCLDEANRIYAQALSRYQARDFEGAARFALASSSISLVVENAVSLNFRSSTDYPNLAPVSSDREESNSELAQEKLEGVKRLNARIRWVIENGTLATDDRKEAENLSQWSFNFCRWAHSSFEIGAKQQALEFARAADALVCAAEHLVESATSCPV